MSTILEALRRAERERQRGSVPTVHDPAPVLAGTMAGPSPVRAPRWFQALALLAAVLALVAALWWWRMPREVAVAAPAAAPVTASVTPAPRAPAPRPAAPSPTASPGASAPAVPASASPPERPATRVAPAPAPAAPRQAPAPKASHPSEPARASTEGPIFAPADLPASVRAELPRLHLAGITWSANARLRMAIVNGQVLHEGESAAPGLVLERIEAARTVWAFRGYRVALASQ